MIPLMMWGMGGGDSTCFLCAGAFLACCAMYGCHKCSKVHIRDCRCIKRLLRCFMCDPYPDMELFLVIHQVEYTAHSKFKTAVQVTAGRQMVATDYDDRGIFHQPVALFVEQGTEFITFEVLDDRGRVIATHTLDLDKDIMRLANGDIRNKQFSMKQKEKCAVNPRIKLSITRDQGNARSTVIETLAQKGTSNETVLILQDHFYQMQADAEEGSKKPAELDLLSSSCCGVLEMVGSWGTREEIWIAVLCPPDRKKHTVGIWKSKQDWEAEVKPKEEIDLLKVLSVQADAGQAGNFLMNYYNDHKVKARHSFCRVDRSRDVWVECWGLLISKCHELKEAKKDQKEKKEKKKGK